MCSRPATCTHGRPHAATRSALQPATVRAWQAEGAWRLLGGDGEIRKPESYLLRYVPQVYLLWPYLLWPYLLWPHLLWPHLLWLYSPLQPGAEFGSDGKMKEAAGSTAGSARAITGTDGRSYFGGLGLGLGLG
jgi:hypothetical protein